MIKYIVKINMITKFKLFESTTPIDLYKKFKKGDRVYCKGYYSGIHFNGETGTILTFYDGLRYEILIKFDEKYYNNFHHGDNFEDPEGKSYYVDYNMAHHLDPEEFEKMKKKREELRNKMIDIDPYGEEDWLEESKLFESSKMEDVKGNFKIGDRVYCEGYYNIQFKGETGTILKFWDDGKNLFEILVKFDKHFSNSLTNGDNNEDPERKSAYVKYELVHFLDPERELEIKREKEQIRLRHMDVDPYEEEDWEF